MRRMIFAMLALGACLLSGCAMCQDCQDELGAVPDSENYSTYESGDRAGSVLSGGETVVHEASTVGYEEEIDEALETDSDEPEL